MNSIKSIFHVSILLTGLSIAHQLIGSEIYVFGGGHGSGRFWIHDDAGIYSFKDHSWHEWSLKDGPEGRSQSDMCWTGSEIIVWGGEIGHDTPVNDMRFEKINTGFAYSPASGKWSRLPNEGAPAPRTSAVCVWTGKEMLIWGGSGTGYPPLYDGAAYDPEKKSWRKLPDARIFLEPGNKTEYQK